MSVQYFDYNGWRNGPKKNGHNLSLVMLFGSRNRWDMFFEPRHSEAMKAGIFSELIFVLNDNHIETVLKVNGDIGKLQTDLPIRVCFHSENNIPKGRNVGIAQARCKNILIWDDDDWIEPRALAEAYSAVFLQKNFSLLELPLSHHDKTPFHPESPDIMPQISFPGRPDLLVLGMVHTPFFLTKELWSRIPFPEYAALRGDWLHWSTELWQQGVPVAAVREGQVAFETLRDRRGGPTASEKPNPFSCYHVLVSLLLVHFCYDVLPESPHGVILRRRYLEKYCTKCNDVWPVLKVLGQHLRDGNSDVTTRDFISVDDEFDTILQSAYGNAVNMIAEYPALKLSRSWSPFPFAPFEIFSPEREQDLRRIVDSWIRSL